MTLHTQGTVAKAEVEGTEVDLLRGRVAALEEEAAGMRRLIAQQAAALSELVTPLIPITDRVVVMPIIGVVDAERAGEVISTLLEGIAKSRARVAILDVTGVLLADAQVAEALVAAAKAVELLGARVVLTGIRPQMAQTFVELGADFGDIPTCGTLREGITHAMRFGEAHRGR